jgi:hypothetical protein
VAKAAGFSLVGAHDEYAITVSDAVRPAILRAVKPSSTRAVLIAADLRRLRFLFMPGS